MEIILTIMAVAIANTTLGVGSFFDATVFALFVVPLMLYERTKPGVRVVCVAAWFYIAVLVGGELYVRNTEWAAIIELGDQLLTADEYLAQSVRPLLHLDSLIAAVTVYFVGGTVLFVNRIYKTVKDAGLGSKVYTSKYQLVSNYRAMATFVSLCALILIYFNVPVLGINAPMFYGSTAVVLVITYILVGVYTKRAIAGWRLKAEKEEEKKISNVEG